MEKEAQTWAVQHGVVPPKGGVVDPGGPTFAHPSAPATVAGSGATASGVSGAWDREGFGSDRAGERESVCVQALGRGGVGM